MNGNGNVNIMLCPFSGNYSNKTSAIIVDADGKVSFDACPPETYIVFENSKWTLKHYEDQEYVWKLYEVKNDSIIWTRGSEKVTWMKTSFSPIMYSASPRISASPRHFPLERAGSQPPMFTRSASPQPQPMFTRSASPQPMFFNRSPRQSSPQPMFFTRSPSPAPIFTLNMYNVPALSPIPTTTAASPISQKVNLLQVPIRNSVSSVDDNSGYESGSESRSCTPEPSKKAEKEPVKQTELPEYRRRQVLVKEMHDWVAQKLKDVLLPEEQCLRGERVLFIPCKSPKSLNNVQILVNELLGDKRLKLTRASLPFSRKNQKQFKGFLLYLEFATMRQVEVVKDEIFQNKFSKIFQKCVIAPPRNSSTSD